MLSRLRFKNWRSLRDVTIEDLTPITVFIGANSSGKTNIIDALKFQRDILQKSTVEVVLELEYVKILTDALRADEDSSVELEFSYDTTVNPKPVTKTVILKFDKRTVPFKIGQKIVEGSDLLDDGSFSEMPPLNNAEAIFLDNDDMEKHERLGILLGRLYGLIRNRWQLLGDNFAPPTRLSNREAGSPYVIEPDGHNTLIILNFMQQAYPNILRQLGDDLAWILGHVDSVDVWRSSGELSLRVHEKVGRVSPTVSTGTSRLLAMLTAYYALEMPQAINNFPDSKVLTPDMPGLIVIEEPDKGLNPGILRNFVEQIRNYVDGEHPRQFILTTHNPRFLDYFQPEEVRIVSRDDDGYTKVERVPDHIRETWLDEYGLGEVWMTNSFGGLVR